MDQGLKEFYFFSEFLNRKFCNASGQRGGKITDLVAERAEPYPMIIGMMVQTRGKKTYLPWERIIQIEPQLTLSEKELTDLKTSLPEKDVILLREEVMDKQIVDTFGAKVVRVNDLHFLRVDSRLRLVHVDVGFRGLMRRGGWGKVVDQALRWFRSAKVVRVNDLHFLRVDSRLRLVHVDVGFRGLMRRVGWEKVVDQALRWLFSYVLSNQFISWKYVQLLSGSGLLHLSVSQKKLSHLHPADLADIMEDLSGRERSAIFHALDAAPP